MSCLSRSFRWRLLLLVGALVIVAQVATFTGVLTILDSDVRAENARRLDSAAGLIAESMAQRSTLLGNGADVLVADFGFRSAIASGDRETIRSALENNAARIGADIAVLHAPDGRAMIANEAALSAAGGLPPALSDDNPDDRVDSVMPLGNLAWQSVVVPVRAPTTIARIALGFALDESVAAELARKTDLQISFGIRDGTGWHHVVTAKGDGQPIRDERTLDKLTDQDAAFETTLAGDPFLIRTLTVADSAGTVRVVLQRSLAEALAPYYKLRNRLVGTSAATLLLGLLAAAWLAHGLSRPLAALTETARHIVAGRYDKPTGIERDDEIGVLASTFDTMRSVIAEREARITHLAMHDELTGLPNQRLGLDRLERAIADARRENGTIATLIAGIDGLDRVFDTLGHPVGESMVIEIARRLVERLRESDSIARIGDDTFLIVLRNIDELAARQLAAELVEHVGTPLDVDSATLAPSVSIGLAWWPTHADNAIELLRRAGIAVGDAREVHGSVTVYQEGRDESMQRQLSLIADLQRAVEEDELLLHYQPKVSTVDGRVHSVEALVRWIHPVHGFMPPDEFIGLAERSGNVSMLSDWVIDRAARQSAEWRQHGVELAIAVNLSALDLRDGDLVARIVDVLARHSLPRDALVIEITESAVVEDPALAIATLSELRALGARVSIDDFGTGQSSLAKLRDLPADELKIDRAFVTDLKPGTPDARIVQAIIELGHGLGMSIVTEGVETLEEQTLIARLGSDSVQGYFHSKPLMPEALMDWLDERDTIRKEAA